MTSLNFERSPETDRLVATLRSVNDTITYEELARRSDLTVRRMKDTLSSARRILRGQKIMFGTIIGVGLQRLNDEQKVDKSEANKKRMMRSAGRALKELDTIQSVERLPPSRQIVVTTNRTIFSLVRQHTSKVPEQAKPASQAQQPDTQNLVALKKKG